MAGVRRLIPFIVVGITAGLTARWFDYPIWLVVGVAVGVAVPVLTILRRSMGRGRQ